MTTQSKRAVTPQFRIREVVISSSRFQSPISPEVVKKTTADVTVSTDKDTAKTTSLEINVTAFVSEVIIFESLDKPYL